MRCTKSTVVTALLLSGFVLTAIGCSGSATSGEGSGERAIPGTSSSAITSSEKPSAKKFTSVGEQIYLTGADTDGQEILSAAPRVAQGAIIMGGGGCAPCHGADGHGGRISVMTARIQSPNVTYGSLTKDGFTDETIRAAIRYGTDEKRGWLAEAMPRWQMTDADVDATLVYLKSLK
jgi:mono/diheme cytochrome c family protein